MIDLPRNLQIFQFVMTFKNKCAGHRSAFDLTNFFCKFFQTKKYFAFDGCTLKSLNSWGFHNKRPSQGKMSKFQNSYGFLQGNKWLEYFLFASTRTGGHSFKFRESLPGRLVYFVQRCQSIISSSYVSNAQKQMSSELRLLLLLNMREGSVIHT